MQITHEGQTLYFVPTGRGGIARAVNVTVIKIGRVWATLSNNNRVNIKTMALDHGGFSSPGTLHLDEAAYKAKRDRDTAYLSLVRTMPHTPPPGVTADDIRRAAALLRIEIQPENKS